ncbi:hypothetical protein HB779_07900 [Phyllobacterium sp. 628]|uniref:hypothetical protein n=1 Tax=Phyllobacterium sp. 628 TaxID=2718938 RepID=UPI0016626732|nr:hypothetical protein [Phyllobacterium sp. 628]QND51832.1 hypothetical protein HB779_07900 [Phyllobacterium sp. 628]
MGKTSEKFIDIIAATFPIAFVYLTGIIYLSAYLSSFSISIHEVDLPIPVVLAYSFNVFSHCLFLMGFGLAILIAVGLFATKRGRFVCLKASPYISNWVLKASLIATFSVLMLEFIYFVANQSATEQSDKIWKDKAATVFFRQPFSAHDFVMGERTSQMFNECKKQHLYKHIMSTQKFTYALCPVKDDEGILFAQSIDGNNFLPLRGLKRWKREQ